MLFNIGVVDRMKDKSSTTVMDEGLHSEYGGEKIQNICIFSKLALNCAI